MGVVAKFAKFAKFPSCDAKGGEQRPKTPRRGSGIKNNTHATRVRSLSHKKAASDFSNAAFVPRTGIEPARLAAHAPETCASTYSATWASTHTRIFLSSIERAKIHIKLKKQKFFLKFSRSTKPPSTLCSRLLEFAKTENYCFFVTLLVETPPLN